MELNEKAKKVFALKYSTRKTKSWKETCRNIADFIAEGERPYRKTNKQIKEIANIFYDMLVELDILPGGRIIANAGTGIKNLANCFVLGIEDSRQSIYQTLKDAAEIFAMGGGVGYDFSKIREEGADIKSTGGKASGALSFMSLFDQTGEVIQQASRRGAQLGTMNISSPDIENFINFKSVLNSRNSRLMQEYDRNLHLVDGRLNGTRYEQILEKTLLDDQLTHFNISVLLTDKFMQRVESNGNWDLISPLSGNIVKTVKAKDLLYQMAKQAHSSGDPGQLFFDRINQDNMVSYMGDITASNPCVSGDTSILTIDGIRTFKELSENNEDVLVYTWNKAKKMPDIQWMRNPRLTKENSSIVEIIFENKMSIKCTNNHNFFLLDGRKIIAKKLKKGQSLNSINLFTGEKIYENKQCKIENIIYLEKRENVYNGTVDNDHNYIIVNERKYDNHVYHGIISANCGEVPLLEGESCILASINLYKMFDKKSKQIDYEKLKNTTKIITRFLEDVTEITEAPLEYINKMSKGLRRLGVGVLGFADLLIELNIPYESNEAIELSRYLSWFINFHAWETSFELAKERGHFKFYNKNKVNLHVVIKTLYDSPFGKSSIPIKKLYKIGLRNVSVTSIAPTGSIAIIGGVNGGIEPFFALAYKRNITEGVGNIATDSIFETNPALERKLKDFNYTDNQIEEILNYVISKGSLIGCKLVSKELQELFKTANDINWKSHIDIQSAWQEYVSNAISKTSNIPENSTIDDIFDIYMYIWKKRLKGGTIYRNNSKSFQILEKPNEKKN